jgi:hypothetical protein
LGLSLAFNAKDIILGLTEHSSAQGTINNVLIILKYYMWWPCLQTDRDEMSILHRGHSIDASYQVLVVDGRSSLKIAHFLMIHYQTWPPQAILVSDWSISNNLLL